MEMTRRSLLGGLAVAGAGSAALGGAGLLAAQGGSGGGSPRLIAHWPLDGDCRDAAGTHHGDGRNLTYVEGHDGRPAGAAWFNGVDALIEVKHDEQLRLGTQEFSISAWINVKQDVESVIGDVLTKFDPETRRGSISALRAVRRRTARWATPRTFISGLTTASTGPGWTVASLGKPTR
jgi:hypothetical protein